MMKHIIYIYTNIITTYIWDCTSRCFWVTPPQFPGAWRLPRSRRQQNRRSLLLGGHGWWPKGENLGGLFALICYT